MIITQVRRIRNWNNYSANITVNEQVRITDDMRANLLQLGFSDKLEIGETLIPSRDYGPVSRFNAYGKDMPQRHLPKETHSVGILWEWKDYTGKEYSEIRYRNYERYPRLHTPAPSVPLTIISAGDEKFVIAGDSAIKGVTYDDEAAHKVNLLLEIFKQAELFHENMDAFVVPEKITRLNWQVLPEGDIPWERFRERLAPVLSKVSERGRRVVYDRLETIANFHPDFQAVGVNGYSGYIIFGFSNLNLYVFESAMYGNATYVFEGHWEHVSKLTKAEIIRSDLHSQRLIHGESWRVEITSLLSPNLAKRFIISKGIKTQVDVS